MCGDRGLGWRWGVQPALNPWEASNTLTLGPGTSPQKQQAQSSKPVRSNSQQNPRADHCAGRSQPGSRLRLHRQNEGREGDFDLDYEPNNPAVQETALKPREQPLLGP